jgi:hypothetical protein
MYSNTLLILKNKNTYSFFELYKNELQDIKDAKIAVKESDSDEARQDNFFAYKDSLVRALEKTIQTSIEA